MRILSNHKSPANRTASKPVLMFQSRILRCAFVFGVIALITATDSFQVDAAAPASDQFQFPYQALVLHDDATVHSGPGQVHYATETLRQGATVEVYRHDPNGWCAIRPVEGSFSLIPQATLEVIEDGVGRIKEGGTQAWVGTKLGPVDKPLWQVRLQKGETVEVLGKVSWPSPEGHSTVWYQVSPPAGEFRWIKMSDLQLPVSTQQTASLPVKLPATGSNVRPDARTQTVRSLNEILQQSPALDPALTIGRVNIGDDLDPSDRVQQVALQTEQAIRSASVNSGWRQSTRSINVAPLGGFSESLEAFGNDTDVASANSPPRFASADLSNPNLATELNSTLAIPRNTQSSFGIGSPTGRTITESMGDLELQLTGEMLKEPVEWRLDGLEQRATTVLRSSPDQNERQLAERFLSKIADCKRLQSGFAGSSRFKTGLTNSLGATQPVGTGLGNDVQLGTTYDAHGWLTEMVRDGGTRQSSYALQDETGRITHHVAPAPGMNLHRYLKKRIGIMGQRGYHSQLKLDHVTAHRIIELQDPGSLRR